MGKQARIPSDQLQPPEVLLRDYSLNPIHIGAQVQVTLMERELGHNGGLCLLRSGSQQRRAMSAWDKCCVPIRAVVSSTRSDPGI